MMTDKPPYELYNGPVDSPIKYVDYCVYQGRQMGKTHKLLMSIPNEPIIIVVHNQQWGREMLRILEEIRPDYDPKNIKFISYGRNGDYLDRLKEEFRGTRRDNRRPIYFDNCVLDMIQYDYVENINKMRELW